MDALRRGRGRVVRFPDVEIGSYYLTSGGRTSNEVCGDARGEVYIPSGWELTLDPRSADAFHHFASLGPADLDGLRYYHPHNAADRMDDERVAFVRYLTGLRRVFLEGVQLSGNDFSWLRHLDALEVLYIWSGREDREADHPPVPLDSLSAKAPIRELRLTDFGWRESHMRRLCQYPKLTILWCRYERSDGTGFAELASLSSLEELLLVDGGRDEDFAVLRDLPRLRQLGLWSSKLTSEVGAHLRMLQDLKILNLRSRSITGAILRDIGRLGSLDELTLSLCGVQGGLDRVADLPLRKLHLDHLPLTDADVRPIGRLAGLEDLRLAKTGVTDAIGPVLRVLHRLQRLDLDSTKITDRTLGVLAGLPCLTRLNVSGTHVSMKAANRLCEANPQLIIQNKEWGGGDFGQVRGELASGDFGY